MYMAVVCVLLDQYCVLVRDDLRRTHLMSSD